MTDLTNSSWPLEPVQMIIAKVIVEFFSVSDLSCAYHQVPLSPETQKLTSFIIGGKQYTYTRGFYGLCGLPRFLSRPMTIQFDRLIEQKQSPTSMIQQCSHRARTRFSRLSTSSIPFLRRQVSKQLLTKRSFF